MYTFISRQPKKIHDRNRHKRNYNKLFAELAKAIWNFGVNLLCRDFNMALFAVIPELRAFNMALFEVRKKPN